MDSGRLKIIDAHAPEWIECVRGLFREYAASLSFSLCFQNFEKELAGLPGDYAPPSGCLFLAFWNQEPAGCGALRLLEPGVCEMKRLYVRPIFRGRGIGRKLASVISEAARQQGYASIRLDTVPSMHDAIGLYRSLGFNDIPAYRANPIPGAIYMQLDLPKQIPSLG